MDIYQILQFLFAILLPVAATVFIHMLQKNTRFGSLGYATQQVLIGIVFGLVAIYGTEFGIQTDHAVMNVRDAAPISSAIIFGGPSGIIAGLIGGIERWFAALWGRGMFTRVGCSVGTIVAGLLAAWLRKYVFEDNKPSLLVMFAIGTIIEVIHLDLIFVTNLDDLVRAIVVVRACTKVMIAAVGISAMLSVAAIYRLEGRSLRPDAREIPISQNLQRGIILAVMTACVLTTAFTFIIEEGVTLEQTSDMLTRCTEDVRNQMLNASTAQQRRSVANNHRAGETGSVIVADSTGKIVSCDNNDYVGTKTLESLGIADDMETSPLGELFTSVYRGREVFCLASRFKDYTIVAIEPIEEAMFSVDVMTVIGPFSNAIVFGILFVVIYFLNKRAVVDNIKKVNTSLNSITNGDLEATVEVYTSQEFTQLSDDINLTVSALKRAISAAEDRINAELEYARVIQRSALPMVFPPFPQHDEFQIFASMTAAKEVGGDFYDFYLLDDNTLAFLIADVSGKGIPGALFMMKSKVLLKNLAMSGLSVEEVLERGNDQLCEGNEAEMFVTCWMGVLNLETGHLEFCNAGHNPPALARANHGFHYHVVQPNLVLAGIDGIPYTAHGLDLEPGDTLFLYTDGITEATNSNQELFGENRLLTSLDTHASLDMKLLCKGVHTDVDSFVGSAPQFDDITMLALRYMGKAGN